MAVQVKRRRGNTAAHAAFTGAAGELTVNTDTWRVHSHDGATVGGHPLALVADLAVECTDTSSAANAIVVASNSGPTAAVDGMMLLITVAKTSTGGVTIAYNGAAAIALVSGTGGVLTPGALQAGGLILVMYRSTLGKYVLLANHGGMPQFAAALPISQGGTGASTAAQAVINLGLTEVMQFAGTWNASTNSPAFTSGTGTPGLAYKVSTAGTTTLDGISQWNVGDIAIFNGITNTWNKIDGQSTEVISVAGRTGAVVITSADLADFATAAAAAAPVQMVAGRTGDVTLEASDVANAADVTTTNTFQKTQAPTIQNVTFATTMTLDLTQGNDAKITLTASGATLATPSNGLAGATGSIEIWQDSTGSRTLSFGAGWKFGANGTPVLSTTAGAMDMLSYRMNSAGNFTAVLVNKANS